MLQRAVYVQPDCGAPPNGLTRSSPKWTAIGKVLAGLPAADAIASKALIFVSAGSGGVGRGSRLDSPRSKYGSRLARSIPAGHPLSNTSGCARNWTFA